MLKFTRRQFDVLTVASEAQFVERVRRKKDADSFARLFANHGWTVENGKTYFQDAAGIKRTGTDLKTYLRSAGHADQVKALAPLRSAGRDAAFRKQQIATSSSARAKPQRER